MGYRGKVVERARARELRAESWTFEEIALELGVAKGTVSVWARDVDFEPKSRRRARNRGPNKLQRRKTADIETRRREGIARVGMMSEREFLLAGVGLYAGDGSKSGNEVAFSNSNPELIRFFCLWFRRFFAVGEKRLRIHLYLHDDLDLEAAEEFWSELCAIPRSQFHKTYRARADPTMRTNRHINGCCHVRYGSTAALREIKGMMEGLVLVASLPVLPG
jgi:transcriptional regulator with XRE-family HTH domain